MLEKNLRSKNDMSNSTFRDRQRYHLSQFDLYTTILLVYWYSNNIVEEGCITMHF